MDGSATKAAGSYVAPTSRNQWYVLTGAVVSVAAANGAVVLGRALGPTPPWLLGAQLALLGVGLILGAAAVVRQPRSSVVLSLAALTCALACVAVDPEWDSLRMALRVLTAAAAAAAVLVALPQRWRRAIVSLVIIYHFVGILTAVGSVPPPGAQASWLTTMLWTRLYRPYLQFMYLNNAYHFYSPEPGPASLLWFHVEYNNGSVRWVKVPNRLEHSLDPLALEYYRRLSITESINQLMPPATPSAELVQRRLLAGEIVGIPTPDEIGLRYLPGMPQYRVPNVHAKLLLQSFARHIASTHTPTDQATAIAGIKIYRLVHGVMPPNEFAAGRDPADPSLYLPYFQGEFDTEGNLKHSDDPLLYWLIPILKVERRDPQNGVNSVEVFDFLELHANHRSHGE